MQLHFSLFYIKQRNSLKNENHLHETNYSKSVKLPMHYSSIDAAFVRNAVSTTRHEKSCIILRCIF